MSTVVIGSPKSSFSADGKTLYFIRESKEVKNNNSDIYVSYLQKDGV